VCITEYFGPRIGRVLCFNVGMAKKVSKPVEVPEEQGTTSISVRLDNDLLAWIDEQAKAENRSRGNWIDTLLKQERARREPLAGLVKK
jgi:hypothetical protein